MILLVASAARSGSDSVYAVFVCVCVCLMCLFIAGSERAGDSGEGSGVG